MVTLSLPVFCSSRQHELEEAGRAAQGRAPVGRRSFSTRRRRRRTTVPCAAAWPNATVRDGKPVGNRAAAHRAYARHAGPGADKVVRLAGTQSPRIETGGFQVALTLNMYSGAAGNFKHVYLSKRKSHAPLAMPLIPLSRSNTPSWNMALNRDAHRQCHPSSGHGEFLWLAGCSW